MGLGVMSEPSSIPHALESRRRRRKPVWARWSDDKLLEVRICDLAVGIEGSPLEGRFTELTQERFLTQMCARFSPSRSAAPWEEAADVLVPANQR